MRQRRSHTCLQVNKIFWTCWDLIKIFHIPQVHILHMLPGRYPMLHIRYLITSFTRINLVVWKNPDHWDYGQVFLYAVYVDTAGRISFLILWWWHSHKWKCVITAFLSCITKSSHIFDFLIWFHIQRSSHTLGATIAHS